AALDGAGLGEGLLHAVQLAVPRQPLHRDHVVAVRLRREDEARADEHAVEEHRARAALALLARVLRPQQAEALAEREEQALALPRLDLARLAVDRQPELHARQRSRARFASTRRAWRR